MPRKTEEAIQRNREQTLSRWHKNADENRKRQREQRERKFEQRPFIAWDGEGYRSFSADPSGTITVDHHYMLFGASTLDYVTGEDLSTKECLDLILRVERETPDAFHVGFAFEYDINMILRDLPWRMLAVLYATGKVRWNGYRLRHTPHKMFTVTRDGCSATIYDVFGFFHSSYLRALQKYGVGTVEQLERISTGKDKRSQFTFWQIEDVVRYWAEEISLLPPLMECVREAAYGGGYRISEWHGPGALASFALRHNHVGEYKSRNVPAEVKDACRYAYAGGRFQCWYCGYFARRVYTADINSAYIYACSLLPRLDKGKWRRGDCTSISSGKDIARFGLYYISYDAGQDSQAQSKKYGMPQRPYPLFHRDRNGRLTWPPKTEGWYWSPEAALVAGDPNARFLEAWIFNDDGTYPFQWVISAYARRLILKEAGNPAEKAYKWALAAMYGAFARRVGWDQKLRTAPRSHELMWAGFITSYCRAMVYRVAVKVAEKRGLISIDTDGVASSVPIEPAYLPTGEGVELGQWKLEEHDEVLYWQNGIYWYRNNGKWSEAKTRGVPRGRVTVEMALEALDLSNMVHRPFRPPVITLWRQRFIGYRQALRQQFRKWRHWETEHVKITMGGNGKGRHVPPFCLRCREDVHGIKSDRMHTVWHFWPDRAASEPHKLPWLEDQFELPRNVIVNDIWDDETL